MRLVMPHVSHWRSFRVEHAPKKIFRLIFDRLREVSAPALEVLNLVVEGVNYPFQETAAKLKLNPFARGEAPSLKELAVAFFPYRYFLTRFTGLQVLQLTHSDFSEAEAIEKVKSILNCLPKLRTLDINCPRYISDSHRSPLLMIRPPPRTSHSSLTELSIYIPKFDLDMNLSSLDLPQVRYFLIRMQVEMAFGLHMLSTLSQYHPFPNLISLRLVGSYSGFGSRNLNNGASDLPNQMNMTHLEGTLAGLPALKALTLDRVDFDGGKWLLCLGTTCPRLHWLTLVQCGRCTLEQIRDVVVTRRKRYGFDALVRLVIEQWSFGNFITSDEGTDEWLKRSLIYEVRSPVGDLKRDTYLSAVEGILPARPPTGPNPRIIRR